MCDLGVLYYYYPGSYPNGFTKPDTTELYAALNWKLLQVKYSYSVGNKTFGFPDSRGSDYIEGNINYDIVDKVNDWLGKITLIGHVGHQTFKQQRRFRLHRLEGGRSHGDFSGVTRRRLRAPAPTRRTLLYTNRFGKNTSDTQFVGYVQKTF